MGIQGNGWYFFAWDFKWLSYVTALYTTVLKVFYLVGKKKHNFQAINYSRHLKIFGYREFKWGDSFYFHSQVLLFYMWQDTKMW